MVYVNCKHKRIILQLLKDLKRINGLRRAMEDKYAPLKRELLNLRDMPIYRPVENDEVDKAFGHALNQNVVNIPVKRLQSGKYMFGTRMILAKIINGKLVIRVGGGYMSVNEFIEQYAKAEMIKMMRQGNLDGEALPSGRDGSGRGSSSKFDGTNAMSMADMKQQMKRSLSNVKTYKTTAYKPEETQYYTE